MIEPSLFDITIDHIGVMRGLIMDRAREFFPDHDFSLADINEDYSLDQFGDINCVIDIKVRTTDGLFTVMHSNIGNDQFIKKQHKKLGIELFEVTDSIAVFSRFIFMKIPDISKSDFVFLADNIAHISRGFCGRDIIPSYCLERVDYTNSAEGQEYKNMRKLYSEYESHAALLINDHTGSMFRFNVSLRD